MKIQTFWIIIVKLAGLWLLHDSLYTIPQFFSFLAVFNTSFNSNSIYTALTLSTLTLLIYLSLTWLCLFKTNKVVAAIRLDRHFKEEKIEVNISEHNFVRGIVILIGGFAFVDGFPALCREVFRFFQQELLIKDYAETSWMLYYFFTSLFGYLIITNSKRIATFLIRES